MATGRIVIDVERCKGCELCLPACPQSVIEMANSLNSKGYHPALYVDLAHDCTGCALCAVVCPDGCITVFRDLPKKRAVRRANEEVLAHV
ncbi:MAG: ferredoxin family protein [Chloroflexi bacterium]|nr:ferredoxin family protein [Chloroflexota bacterium]